MSANSTGSAAAVGDIPTEVRADREKRCVIIEWKSGHHSVFLFDYLRGYCPCAVCQGHNSGPKKYIAPPANLGLAGIKPVGAYAIQFTWSDGHSTGLYTFEYLRERCPCCRGN